MCGITGYFGGDVRVNAGELAKMTAALIHRGPDGLETWLSEDLSVGLGHTRLSVIDIQGGSQPMHSCDGTLAITFNGEIYNYQELRVQLEKAGHVFRTRSDTEVIIEAYRYWGSDCLQHLNGMFALAIYDAKCHELFLARDRTGIKPLYWYDGAEGFFFGSELKSILSVPFIPRQLNHQALVDFMVFGYPLHTKTFFRKIYEMKPGTWLKIGENKRVKSEYWHWHRKEENYDLNEAMLLAKNSLISSVKDHLVSDVPVGAFLSGGIDSSLLVALITKEIGVQVDTFTMAFDDKRYDESHYAKEVANILGTRHHEIQVSVSEENRYLAEEVMDQFDQPFGDSSAIPSFLISKHIRDYVKVAIAGDGGDEMFGGYPRYQLADRASQVQRSIGWALPITSELVELSSPLVPSLSRIGRRFLRAAMSRDSNRFTALSSYSWPNELTSELTSNVFAKVDTYRPDLMDGNNARDLGGAEFIDATINYALPGDYLRKVDISSGANGLEVRVPYLGNQVIDCVSRLKNSHKYNMFDRKIILRRLAENYLPKSITQRPKAGFGIPLDRWLSTKEKFSIKETLIRPDSAIRELISPEYCNSIMSNFVKNERDKSKHSRFMIYQRAFFLWSLERWLQRWRPII